MERTPPFFSIIVPTHNRAQQLVSCLQSLRALDYPHDRFEVIVVDDGSESTPDEIVGRFHSHMKVVLLRQAHGGPAAARNTGALRAKGQFLAFTGDDCSPARDWLKVIAARFESEPDHALGGRVINDLSSNAYTLATHLLLDYLYSYYNSLPDRARFFTPNNLALPAHLFTKIGGFDPAFDLGAGEDREFCYRWLRNGYRMVYVPEVIVYHTHPLNLHTFWRLHFNYGRGSHRYRAKVAERYGERVRIEPVRFYVNLLCCPASERYRLHLIFLLTISQVASAAGSFWGAVQRLVPKKPLECLRDWHDRA